MMSSDLSVCQYSICQHLVHLLHLCSWCLPCKLFSCFPPMYCPVYLHSVSSLPSTVVSSTLSTPAAQENKSRILKNGYPYPVRSCLFCIAETVVPNTVKVTWEEGKVAWQSTFVHVWRAPWVSPSCPKLRIYKADKRSYPQAHTHIHSLVSFQ